MPSFRFTPFSVRTSSRGFLAQVEGGCIGWRVEVESVSLL